MEIAGVHRNHGLPSGARVVKAQMTPALAFLDKSRFQERFEKLFRRERRQPAHATCGSATCTPKIVGRRDSDGIGSPRFASASR